MTSYKLLWASDHKITTSEDIHNILLDIGLDKGKFQIGKTKIYMNEKQYQYIRNKHEEKVNEYAIVLQRWMHTLHQRKQFQRMKGVATKWQVRELLDRIRNSDKWGRIILNKSLTGVQNSFPGGESKYISYLI